MASKGPLLTLLGGGMLAGMLLVASVVAAAQERDDTDPEAAGAAPTTEAPEAGLSPSPEPEPSPEPAEEVVPVSYVGGVDGGGASVAIVLNGDDAIAYVCDGEIEAWLSGPVGEGELALAGDDAELTASYDDNGASGEITALGETWSFTTEQVDEPQGLYRVADTFLGGAEVDGGWIVLPDGRQIGVLTVDGATTTAPELDTATGEVAVPGGTVTAERVGD